MKKYFTALTIFLIAAILSAHTSFAEEKTGFVKTQWRKALNRFKKQAPEAPKPALMSLSKEELKERIKYMLEITPEIADFIPESKDIEKLDKESLMNMHNRINNERMRIQTQRIQSQLEAARASQNIPKPPRVYTPPSLPKAPPAPPAVPRIPKPPPLPPPRPRR